MRLLLIGLLAALAHAQPIPPADPARVDAAIAATFTNAPAAWQPR
jgi:hypothetical protein